jgi:hypothetical protein
MQDALEAIDRIPELSARSEIVATLALGQAVNKNPAAGSTMQLAPELVTQFGS